MSHSALASGDAVHLRYRAHYGWLRNWLRARLGDSCAAADLTRDTFVRVWRRRHERDALREPRACLTAIAKRLARHHRRCRSLRLDGASLPQRGTVGGEWYGNKTEQNSSGYDNCPVIAPGAPKPPFPSVCDMLHTNQTDMPRFQDSRRALRASDGLGFADGRYTVMPTLRHDHYAQKPKATARYASNRNGGGLPPDSGGDFYSGRRSRHE